MEERYLDYVLVPFGLGLMVAYHSWLLFRILARPTSTVVGINAINRTIWVRTMMKDPAKNGVLAVQTFRNNIMASTLMASTAITLASLIAVLMSNGSANSGLVVGDKSQLGQSVKLFAILACFLLAFLLFVQSVRYYSHATFLINVPVAAAARNRAAAVSYVARALNRGGYFWSLGLRAYYFSFPLFLWVFGPVPMSATCLIMVFVLYFLDTYSGDDGSSEGQLWVDSEEDEC